MVTGPCLDVLPKNSKVPSAKTNFPMSLKYALLNLLKTAFSISTTPHFVISTSIELCSKKNVLNEGKETRRKINYCVCGNKRTI